MSSTHLSKQSLTYSLPAVGGPTKAAIPIKRSKMPNALDSLSRPSNSTHITDRSAPNDAVEKAIDDVGRYWLKHNFLSQMLLERTWSVLSTILWYSIVLRDCSSIILYFYLLNDRHHLWEFRKWFELTVSGCSLRCPATAFYVSLISFFFTTSYEHSLLHSQHIRMTRRTPPLIASFPMNGFISRRMDGTTLAAATVL